MNVVTFDELFAMPDGTVFGQSGRQEPEFGTGLYVKRESCVEEGDGLPRSIDFLDILPERHNLMDGVPCERWVFADEVNEGRCFLIYEPADLDRLAAVIGRGPMVPTPEEPSP